MLLVTNAAAGSTDRDSIDEVLAVLRDRDEVELAESAGPDDLEPVLDSAGDRTVVVAGGDGSLHFAVAALRRLGRLSPQRPIGLLPLGTGNDFARTLGLPLDPRAAATVLLGGRPRTLDLVVDDAGGVVINAVHLGVGAQAAEQASALKPRLGKAAFPIGGAVAGARAEGWRLRVEADGTVLHADTEPALMVALANGRTIGGGAELAPAAQPDDGVLDVIIATSTGPLARLGFGLALRKGEHAEREDVLSTQARSVTVTGEPFPVNADGELYDGVTSRTWTVEPSAWSMVVPV